MMSVSRRARTVKQPYGGYIRPSSFVHSVYNDDYTIAGKENVSGSIIGMTVDYLTRFIMGTDRVSAFHVSINGAIMAKKIDIAKELLANIKGLDDESIISACKLVTFDVWFRNMKAALLARDYSETNPDSDTINNIRVLVIRSLKFFEKYGPIIKDGFTFEPTEKVEGALSLLMEGKNFGGYTKTVASGDGDFLTVDTLWDFKVSWYKPNSQHTLQLLMYWIMGQHSGQEIFKGITKLGIFNPRLNTVYLFEMKNLPDEIIKEVEDNVICYGGNEKID
ncbi:MAG: hypothetical protein J5501_02880 [Ruminococcus sp.]|nr:hypothetical protein [Ruminococcus sp.]